MDIHQLIAALDPDAYCEPRSRGQVKKLLKTARGSRDEQGLLTAADKTQLAETNAIDLELLEQENPFRLPGFKSPIERHTLVHDAFDQSLEAFYFCLLDELQAEDWSVRKLSDTFLATPGSGLFADLIRRQTQAQHEVTKLLREAQALIHDVLRAVASHNWKLPSVEGPLSTDHSRSQAEAHLLRSKVETLKLYARWLGPYLRQARQLEQNAGGEAGLVSLFNTAAIEITSLAERPYPVEDDVDRGELPKMFLKAKRRIYCPVLILELKVRAAPERASPGAYGYRGRFDLTLTSYALNQEELAVLRGQMDRENLHEVVSAVAGKASETLNQLLNQMDSSAPEPAKPEAKPDDPNPFLALFGLEDRPSESEAGNNADSTQVHWWTIAKDTEIEAVVRSQAILDARRRCLEFYNRCKASLGMPRF